MCSSVKIGSDGTVGLEALEREITELASHLQAATCRWLGLIAEFDEREGWAAWGCRSCAHWVSWRCGLAPVAAREHVRVARRLQQLPLIREAFAAGRLSYSKVRALCRLREVECEEELLGLALHATAAQLERTVRAYRGVIAAEEAAAGEHAGERWLDYHHEDDGSLMLSARLPAEDGALVLAAIEAAREWAAANDSAESARDDSRPGGSDSAESARDHSRASRSDSAESPRDRSGHGDRADAPIGDDADDAVVADSAEAGPTIPQARADALVALADSFLAHQPRTRNGGDRYQVLLHIDAQILRTQERGERCELDDGTPLAAETARRLACDAAIVPLLERAGKPLGVGRKTRSIPPALRRALRSRDHGCRFPGCTSHRHVDAHHIRHWAHGGPTTLTNLVLLCRHHHRLLHEGGYTLHAHPDGRLTFHRPDGRRIRPCPTPPPGRPAALRQRRPGQPAIDPKACEPIGDQHLDLGLAVDALLQYAPPHAATPAYGGHALGTLPRSPSPAPASAPPG